MSAFKLNPYGGTLNGGVVELKLKDSNGSTKNVSNLTRSMDIFIPADSSTVESHPYRLKRGDMLVTNLNVTDNMSAIYVWVTPETNNTRILILLRKDAKPTLKEYDFRQEIHSIIVSKNVSDNASSDQSVHVDGNRYLMFVDNDDLNQTAAGNWFCGFYHNGSVFEGDPEESSFNTTIFQLTCQYLNTTSNKWQYDGCKVCFFLMTIIHLPEY